MSKQTYKSETEELKITIQLSDGCKIVIDKLEEIEMRNLLDGVMILAIGKNRKAEVGC